MRKYLIFIVTVLTVFAQQEASAQRYPERRQVRKGNRAYEREDYGRSIERYTRAAELAPESFEAQYNLANALFRTQAYDKAAEIFGALAADSLRSLQDRADAFYGLGDAQLAQQQLKEALESFKNTLRINPDDEEARFNYAYTKKLLKDQQNQQNQNQDQNKDQNQNQQNQNGQGQQNPEGQNGKDKQDPQNRDGQDPQNQDGQGQQNPDDPSDKNPEGDGGQQPRPSKISPEEQQRMLDAIQAQEDRTQEKLKEKVPVRVRGTKSW